MNLAGSTIGIAFVGQVCNSDLSTGVTEDGLTRSLDFVVTIASHELGHIFNMQHDNGECVTIYNS